MVKTKAKITTSINFTWVEHEKIEKKAAELHISKSAFIRSLIFPRLEKLDREVSKDAKK